MFDPTSFTIAGIQLIVFTFGIVQLLKDWFAWEGKKVTALSAITGMLVMAIYQVMQFLPPEVIPYFEAVFLSVGMGLAASGYYKFATRNDS